MGCLHMFSSYQLVHDFPPIHSIIIPFQQHVSISESAKLDEAFVDH